jgi:hypothetical protein
MTAADRLLVAAAQLYHYYKAQQMQRAVRRLFRLVGVSV